MNVIEWVATLAILSSVILLAKGKASGWIMSIIGCALYSYLFIEKDLYANFAIQIFFILQGAYGLFVWNKQIEANKKFQCKKLEFLSFILLMSVTISVSIGLSSAISMLTDDKLSFIDSVLSISSLIATFGIAKRYIQTWFLWMIIDIGYIWMFLNAEMYLSALLYFILLLICVNAYFKWNKLLN